MAGSGSYVFGEVGDVFLVYLEFSVYEVELIEVCPYTPDGLLVPCHDKKSVRNEVMKFWFYVTDLRFDRRFPISHT